MAIFALVASGLELACLFYAAHTTWKFLKGPYDAERGASLLQMWTVLSFLPVYESYAEWSISFWMPFYWELKSAALGLLFFPRVHGPALVFGRVVRPAVEEAESRWQRVAAPRLASFALQRLIWLQTRVTRSLLGSMSREELHMWHRALHSQAAFTALEVERRRPNDPLLSLREPDATAAALLQDLQRQQLLLQVAGSPAVKRPSPSATGAAAAGGGGGGDAGAASGLRQVRFSGHADEAEGDATADDATADEGGDTADDDSYDVGGSAAASGGEEAFTASGSGSGSGHVNVRRRRVAGAGRAIG